MRSVISNTSCLIALSNIRKLELLHDVYGYIFITDEVAMEFGEPLPEWINVVSVKDKMKTELIANIYFSQSLVVEAVVLKIYIRWGGNIK